MEKANVPMQPYPQTPEMTGQPPIYHDPNAQYQQQPGQHAGSPPPQQPQSTYTQPQSTYTQPQQGQPGMPPQQPNGTVYQTATPIANLQRGPAPADCPACGQRSMTNIAYETGNSTHAWAVGLCLCLCLGCIPYLMNSLKDVTHKCGRCGVLLATWHRSGSTEVHIHA